MRSRNRNGGDDRAPCPQLVFAAREALVYARRELDDSGARDAVAETLAAIDGVLEGLVQEVDAAALDACWAEAEGHVAALVLGNYASPLFERAQAALRLLRRARGADS